MTFMRLLLRNLAYHWRGNIAVLFGAAVGAAVLTGALFVGDSLKNSLRSLALDQLSWVEVSLTANRFFRQELAADLKAKKTAPVLFLQASASFESSATGEIRRDAKVSVLGVGDGFWPAGKTPLNKAHWQSADDGAVLNISLANRLGVKVGDSVTLHVQKADNLPRESLLGHRDSEKMIQDVTVKVRSILPDRGIGGFTLRPSPEPARNLFVPLAYLQNKLGLKNRVNVILAVGDSRTLQERLRKSLTLDDWNLRLQTPAERGKAMLKYLNGNRPATKLREFKWKGRVPEPLAKSADKDGVLTPKDFENYFKKHRPYLSLESNAMFLEPAVQQAVERMVKKRKQIQATKILVYLADTLTDGKQSSPYVIVGAAAPMSKSADDSLPPFKLSGREMLLAKWPNSPFAGEKIKSIDMIYYMPDEQGDLQKRKESFTVVGRFSLTGFYDDANLTPEFPGITDQLDMGNWDDPPFPYDGKRVGPDDEQYWQRYRATPRAYIAFATAQKLWASRFGKLTSIHIATKSNGREFKHDLLQQLAPKSGGFVFDDTRKRALISGGGSTDFGLYFLAFSFFLIVAALLLVGLLFRLNLDRRASEIGLLMAMGLRRGTVRRLLLAEGSILAGIGSLLGMAGAVAYGIALIWLLRAEWPKGQDISYLQFHAATLSMIIGYVASVIVSILAIVWSVRALSRVPASQLLAGQTASQDSVQTTAKKRTWSFVVCGLALVGAVACLLIGMNATHHEAKAGSFFGGGALLLTACLALVWHWMKNARPTSSESSQSIGRLGMRNATRHPVRSLLTVGLLSSATFLIVAVESFHRETGSTFFAKDGGSGGFRLLAETNGPLFIDWDDFYADLNRRLEFAKSRNKKKQAARLAKIAKQAQALIPKIKLFSFRVKAGDDVSCLNLYQPLQPKTLGVPDGLIRRGGFQFSKTLAETKGERDNPWLLLKKKQADGAVPIFVDATTAQYILKVGLGDVMEVPDEEGRTQKLRVVGMLSESVFQSELLMADASFQRLFPRIEGFRYFLIEVPADQQKAIKTILETGFSKYGFAVTPTDVRLRSYLAVENTYLGMFKLLGGFGLLLGALGLSVVLLRGVWERRGELALMRALGFRKRSLGWLVLAENSFLLALGLAVGTVSALISVAPHLTATGSDLLLRIAVLLALVVAVGLIAGIAAVVSTLKAPLLIALRKD